MKWYVCESRNGADSFRCRASSPEAAMRAAHYFDPSTNYVRVREAYAVEVIEAEKTRVDRVRGDATAVERVGAAS